MTMFIANVHIYIADKEYVFSPIDWQEFNEQLVDQLTAIGRGWA